MKKTVFPPLWRRKTTTPYSHPIRTPKILYNKAIIMATVTVKKMQFNVGKKLLFKTIDMTNNFPIHKVLLINISRWDSTQIKLSL